MEIFKKENNGVSLKQVDDFCFKMESKIDALNRAKQIAEENKAVDAVTRSLCKSMLDKFTVKGELTSEQLLSRAYKKVMKNIVNYVNDMALTKDECSQMLKDIFREAPEIQYEKLSNKLFGIEAEKVDLF